MKTKWTWPNTELLEKIVQTHFKKEKICSGEMNFDSKSGASSLDLSFPDRKFLTLVFEQDVGGFGCEEKLEKIFCEKFLTEHLGIDVNLLKPETEMKGVTSEKLKHEIKEHFRRLKGGTLHGLDYIIDIENDSSSEFLVLEYKKQQTERDIIENISLAFPPFSLVGIAYCGKNGKIIIAEFPKMWEIIHSHRGRYGGTTIYLPATSRAEIRDLLKQVEIDPDSIEITYRPVSKVGGLSVTKITEKDEIILRFPSRLGKIGKKKEYLKKTLRN